MLTEEALSLAQEKGLDLVEVAKDANPPVCRIMDYGKYKYMQKKRKQESKRKQSQVQIKEIKFRIKIEEHDFNFKVRNIKKFLSEGFKVKVGVFFRGREITRGDIGREILSRVLEELKGVGTNEQEPRLEGRLMSMMVAPVSRRSKPTETAVRKGEGDAKDKESPGSSEAL